MQTRVWLRVGASRAAGGLRATGIRASKSRPNIYENEIAFALDLTIPDALFTRPMLVAKVEVPEDAVSQPVIPAEVQNNIAAILSEQLGLVVRVTAEPPE